MSPCPDTYKSTQRPSSFSLFQQERVRDKAVLTVLSKPSTARTSPSCNTLYPQSPPNRGRSSASPCPLCDLKGFRTDHKDIIRIRYHPSLPQQLVHIPELSMNIPADRDRRVHLMHIGFLHKDVSHPCTEGFHLAFWKVFTL